MECCSDCVADPDLKNLIIQDGVLRPEPCSYCGSSATKRIYVDDLQEAFTSLVDLHYISHIDLPDYRYVDPSIGEPLSTLFCDNFEPFTDKVKNPDELFYAIVNSGGHWKDPVEFSEDDPWFPKRSRWDIEYTGAAFDQLNSAIREHGHSLAFDRSGGVQADPATVFAYVEVLSNLKEESESLGPQMEFWRARRGRHIEHQEMSSPPPEKALAGRGNLQGQPVLYLSNNRETAISEVRPSKLDIVSVCRFKPSRDIRVCDLLRLGKDLHPFGDFEKYERQFWINHLRFHLGSELARPVSRGDEAKDYLITQYLCGMVAKAGFDGVLYRSAQGGTDGKNYMLFDPTVCSVFEEIEHVRVNNIHYETTTIARKTSKP